MRYCGPATLIHYQFAVTFQGAKQRIRRRRRVQEERGELLLRFAREPNYFNLGDSALCGILRRSNYKITDGAPLNLGGAANHGEGFGRDPRFNPRGSGFLRFHG
jgi:hypothetical protein